MKKFVNKTKQQKRVVVYEDKDKSSTKTFFLRRGQSVSTSLTPKHVDEGVKEVSVSKTSTKTTNDSKKDNVENKE